MNVTYNPDEKHFVVCFTRADVEDAAHLPLEVGFLLTKFYEEQEHRGNLIFGSSELFNELMQYKEVLRVYEESLEEKEVGEEKVPAFGDFEKELENLC